MRTTISSRRGRQAAARRMIPSFSGKGLRFETLDHGGDYLDMMPQAIRVTDPEGNSCEYVAVNPLRKAAVR
jgi:hypothetical protein